MNKFIREEKALFEREEKLGNSKGLSERNEYADKKVGVF